MDEKKSPSFQQATAEDVFSAHLRIAQASLFAVVHPPDVFETCLDVLFSLLHYYKNAVTGLGRWRCSDPWGLLASPSQ